jgi:hypothetical protein
MGCSANRARRQDPPVTTRGLRPLQPKADLPLMVKNLDMDAMSRSVRGSTTSTSRPAVWLVSTLAALIR